MRFKIIQNESYVGVALLAPQCEFSEIRVSPEHALYIDGMLIPAAALTNDITIFQDQTVQEITYIHLELDGHAVIYAEGAASESFVDDESRGMFDNAHECRALNPTASCEPVSFCAPRVEEGVELEVVRQRLAARAAARQSHDEGLAVEPCGGPESWRPRGRWNCSAFLRM
jgi:Hint domain